MYRERERSRSVYVYIHICIIDTYIYTSIYAHMYIV